MLPIRTVDLNICFQGRALTMHGKLFYICDLNFTPELLAPAKELHSMVVVKKGIGFNYELMKKLPQVLPVFTQADALRLEKTWAKELHSIGYLGGATPCRESMKCGSWFAY